jgi:eukaryotic-like serine/threonine-protein kinase
MNPERWEKVARLHRSALEREESGRAAFLRDACAGDDELRREVESLLASGFDDFMESPALDVAARLLAQAGSPSVPLQDGDVTSGADDGQARFFLPSGTRLGNYQIIRLLGSGGMGQVYLAEQTEPVHRQVALKLIKTGVFDEVSLKRFRSERQAQAIMDHPAIARVFDAGATPEGQPYITMEYVPGLPITRYCDEHKVSVRQRVELFNKVCEGVQHAHQKAIIHRDLKPANILIVDVDGHPQPRIIDFGIAKPALPTADATLLTQQGGLVGTPGYMSPEQAQLGEDVDTRSDVYSLGATLYELLTGSLPFDPKQWRNKPWPEVLRQLREDDPPRPSTKVSLQAENSSTAAEVRGTEPRHLAGLLRGDLDWITMKALEKDRARRYGTPSELAADLNRYLRHEPVIAGPAGAGYVLGRYIRRHRIAVALCAGLVLLLAAFSIVQAVQIRRITRERDRANRIGQFMTDMFRATDPGVAQGKTITAREMLDKAAAQIDTGLADDPELQAALMYTMGDVYQNMGLYAQSQQLLQRSLDIRRHVLGPDDPDTLESLQDIGETLAQAGHPREAERVFRQVLDARRRVLGADSPKTLRTMNWLAQLLREDGDYADAEKIYRQVLQARIHTVGPTGEPTLETMDGLARVLASEGQFPEAEKLARQAADVRRNRKDPSQMFTGAMGLAEILEMEHHYQEAEPLYREAIDLRTKRRGPEHPHTLNAVYSLASVLFDEGRYTEAEPLARSAFETRRQVLGPEHPDTLDSMDLLGRILTREGRYREAEELLRSNVELARRTFGAGDSDTATVIYDLACATLGNSREPDHRGKALALLREAVNHGVTGTDTASIEQDPALKELRGDPKFEALVAEAHHQSAASQQGK